MIKKSNVLKLTRLIFILIFAGAYSNLPVQGQRKKPERKNKVIVVQGVAPTLEQKAENCFEYKNYRCAVEYFSRVIETDPKNINAFEKRGLSYFNFGSSVGSADYVDGLLTGQNTRNLDNAVADFTQAIKLNPSKAQNYFYRATAYSYGDGKDKTLFDKAIADLTKAVSLEPQNAVYYKTRGYIYYFFRNDFANAFADYDRAIALRPEHADAYYRRGELYANSHRLNLRHDYQKAFDDYSAAIKLEPNKEDYFSARAYLYKQVKDFDAAVKDYDKLIELNPQKGRYYDYRAEIYVQKGEFEKAVKDYTKSIALSPASHLGYLWRAKVFLQMNDFAKAHQDYQKVIEIGGEFFGCQGYDGRGAVSAKQKDFQKALNYFDKAIELCQYDEEFFVNRAAVYRAIGKIDLAEKDLKKAAEIKEEGRKEIERLFKGKQDN